MSFEIASYLDILDLVFLSFECLPHVTKVTIDSLQQAISHLHMTSAVCMAKSLLHKRDKVLN